MSFMLIYWVRNHPNSLNNSTWPLSHATISCEVEEDKMVPGQERKRFHLTCNTQLDFEVDRGKVGKIVKIYERTSMVLVSLVQERTQKS